LTGFCLMAGLFTACEKPNEEGENGGGSTGGGKFASIQGKVTDKETGEPLSYATIEIQPGGKPVGQYEQTAEDGTYIIKNLKAGIYTIQAEKYEYQDYTQENVKLVAGQTTTLDVEIEVEEGMELQIEDDYGHSIEELICGIEGSFRLYNNGNRKGKWSIEYDADCIAEISPASGTIDAYSSETITVKKKLLKEDKKTVITIKTKNEDLQLPVAIKGFKEMEVVYVTGGELEMGATEEQGDDANEEREKPVRTIRLDSYYIGKYEVTQAQWLAVMGQDRYGRDYEYGKGDDYPVYYVNWSDAQEFCKKLSEATGKKYVLPTEAQWEYAARGGNKSQHYKYAGSNDIDEVAWYEGGDFAMAHPVGQKKANELGIYDMSGNVAELCSDWYGKYDEKDTENPQGPAEGYGSSRVMRGGGYESGANSCRVSYRSEDGWARWIGFRVVYLP
ncbi:MAG: SUMF1/EgtB/PvdO family nonheme iron enzyme, partial [Bacteroidales bacterium]|nr:SUMF1/EgtB/PvdO family nonheme iron enzyme [Bacteroidales bacterium]